LGNVETSAKKISVQSRRMSSFERKAFGMRGKPLSRKKQAKVYGGDEPQRNRIVEVTEAYGWERGNPRRHRGTKRKTVTGGYILKKEWELRSQGAATRKAAHRRRRGLQVAVSGACPPSKKAIGRPREEKRAPAVECEKKSDPSRS